MIQCKRPEGVAAGTLRLVGTDEETIYRNFKELLENQEAYEVMSHACNRLSMGSVKPGWWRDGKNTNILQNDSL